MKLIQLACAGVAVLLLCCGPQKEQIKSQDNLQTDADITPAPFPDLGIPGFTFPTDSNTVNGWVANEDKTAIYQHGWGIWAGLTAPSGQSIGGQELLVFETWLTPSEILDSMKNVPVKRIGRANLNKPKQFGHALAKSGENPDTDIAESVSYSPAATKYALDNKIFLYSTMKAYADEGRTSIPDFPSNAITLKPVFKVITKDKLDASNLYPMPTWVGPIDSVASFPESAWNACTYVDINNGGAGDGSVDIGCNGPTPQTTYNLTDFIYYALNEEDVAYYNQEFGLNAQAGDYAILVGMHVGTREIKRWTWQSFWWTPDPQNPPTPSSKEVASQMPVDYLNGAASHYAMTNAYYMVSPPQPYTGGQSVGDTVIAFNPYLESGFGPGVFTGSNSYVVKNGVKIPTDAGVRTNCMSCHIYAAYDVNKPSYTPPYSGDAYVSLDDPVFDGLLKADFAWSVVSNVDTTGIAKMVTQTD